MSARTQTDVQRPAGWIAAAAVAVAMTLAALSLWTVVPIGWIWIGSKIASSQFPSGGPYMVTFFGIVASILILGWVIGWLNRYFVRLTGSDSVASIRPIWLRSSRDTVVARRTTVLEAVIASSVVLAIVTFGVWFFVAAGSPLPNQ